MCSVFITILNEANTNEEEFANVCNHATREIQSCMNTKKVNVSKDTATNNKMQDKNIAYTIEFIVFVVQRMPIDSIFDKICKNLLTRNARFVCYIALTLDKATKDFTKQLYVKTIATFDNDARFGFVATMDPFSKRLKQTLEEHGVIDPESLFRLLACVLI